MPNAIDLCVLADLKNWLQVSAGTDDGLLAKLITNASQWVLSALNRPNLLSASYTEVRHGTGGDALYLQNYPVTVVASVTASGISIPPSPDSIQAGYVFDQDAVYLIGYTFCRGRNNVTVAYTAGFAAIPLDLTQAAIAICAAWYKRRNWTDQASKSIQGEVVAFRKEDIPPEAKVVIDQYKRRIPV